MDNLKIVLNWASICTSSVPMEAGCDTCPYREKHDGFRTCIEGLLFDALALLKEQEEQIKNRDESLEKAREEIKWLREMLKEQKMKIGHWIIVEYDILTCSYCGNSYYTGCDSMKEATANLEKGNVYHYCPYCGSKMEGW